MEDSTFPIPKLPNDAIIEILTRLPAKPLFKFKCVCKSWRALISSQQFVAAHLENSKSDPNFTKHRVLMRSRGNFKQVSANSLFEPVSVASDLSSPFHPDSYREVVGSCNGLVCLSAEFSIPGNEKYFRRELHLWNPSTRISKELPNVSVNANRGLYGVSDYGFGYDKSSDDYKVVRFLHDMVLYETEVLLQVYSLRNDEWKTVKSFVKRYWHMKDPATFVDGKLYWIGYDWNELYVVRFDLETEEYDDERLRLPDCSKSDCSKWLGESGGSLMVMCFHKPAADVWNMDGDERWSKVATIPYIDAFYMYCDLALYVMNRPVLVLVGGSVVISDAGGCSFRRPKIRNSGDFVVCCGYIESLVSPLG